MADRQSAPLAVRTLIRLATTGKRLLASARGGSWVNRDAASCRPRSVLVVHLAGRGTLPGPCLDVRSSPSALTTRLWSGCAGADLHDGARRPQGSRDQQGTDRHRG